MSYTSKREGIEKQVSLSGEKFKGKSHETFYVLSEQKTGSVY